MSPRPVPLPAKTDLLPCPFCKGEPIPERALRDGYEGQEDDQDAWAYVIRCRSCAAEGGWAKSASGGERNWNMRAGMTRFWAREKCADEVEAMCHWKWLEHQTGVEDLRGHRTFHFGYTCPYEAAAAVLRGQPDPRESPSYPPTVSQ